MIGTKELSEAIIHRHNAAHANKMNHKQNLKRNYTVAQLDLSKGIRMPPFRIQTTLENIVSDLVKGTGSVNKDGYMTYAAADGNGWLQRDGDGWHKYQTTNGKSEMVNAGDITDQLDSQWNNDHQKNDTNGSNLTVSDKWKAAHQGDKVREMSGNSQTVVDSGGVVKREKGADLPLTQIKTVDTSKLPQGLDFEQANSTSAALKKAGDRLKEAGPNAKTELVNEYNSAAFEFNNLVGGDNKRTGDNNKDAAGKINNSLGKLRETYTDLPSSTPLKVTDIGATENKVGSVKLTNLPKIDDAHLPKNMGSDTAKLKLKELGEMRDKMLAPGTNPKPETVNAYNTAVSEFTNLVAPTDKNRTEGNNRQAAEMVNTNLATVKTALKIDYTPLAADFGTNIK